MELEAPELARFVSPAGSRASTCGESGLSQYETATEGSVRGGSGDSSFLQTSQHGTPGPQPLGSLPQHPPCPDHFSTLDVRVRSEAPGLAAGRIPEYQLPADSPSNSPARVEDEFYSGTDVSREQNPGNSLLPNLARNVARGAQAAADQIQQQLYPSLGGSHPLPTLLDLGKHTNH